MAKKLKTLAKELELDNEHDYYSYIVASYMNGNRLQVIELFSQMKKENKCYFLNKYLIKNETIHNNVKDICVEQLCL